VALFISLGIAYKTQFERTFMENENVNVTEEVVQPQTDGVETPVVAEQEKAPAQSAEENTRQADIRRTNERDKAIAEMADIYGIPNVKSYNDVRQAKLSKLSGGAPPALTSSPNVDLTPDEKTALQTEFNSVYQQLINDGTPDSAAQRLANIEIKAKENSLISAKQTSVAQIQQKQQGQFDQLIRDNPEYYKDGKISIPDEVHDALVNIMAVNEGMSVTAAHKIYASDKAIKDNRKEMDELKATVAVLTGNKTNSEATTGSVVSGSPAAEKDFYTSKEWDELPHDVKMKLFHSGAFDKSAAKWK
jgi:hypothetical protein